MVQSVSKRQHIKFRHRVITQKKEYNIRNTAKFWDQKCIFFLRLLGYRGAAHEVIAAHHMRSRGY
jgi:Holliday junction resolvase-like predicted endonuclease